MIDGKRKTKSFITKSEAKKWEARQVREAWDQPKIPTVLSVSNDYLDDCRLRYSKKTYLEKRRAFKALLKYVDHDCRIDMICSKQVYHALNAQAKLSGSVANRCRKNLIAWWNWASKIYHLPEQNPFSRVSKFKESRQPRYIPPERDFWAAYNHASKPDQAFLLFALHTAARRGEIFRLKWSDVDFENKTVKLGSMKTRDGSMEYVTLPMTDDLCRELLDHRNRGLCSLYVFSREDGQPYTNRQHYMRRLCKRAKVAHFGFHAIRHLSASILAKAGVPLPTIQAILRHKSATTTARYLHSIGVVEDILSEVFTKDKSVTAKANKRN